MFDRSTADLWIEFFLCWWEIWLLVVKLLTHTIAQNVSLEALYCFTELTFFYSIESRKCGVCRQRKSSGARRKTECSWWPCMKNWFSSWNSMLPWGQGWAFLPWNKPAGLLKGKNAHPCPKGCILLSEENQCWMQGNQVLKIFFDCKRAVSV